MRPLLLLTVSLSACIRDVERGPKLGPCAEVPEGVYTYGDAGIGRCLAGPADVTFFQQDGGSFLAVSNADPYRIFETGSTLVVDWDATVEMLEAEARPARLKAHELRSWALEIRDDDDGDGDGGNPYLGGVGYLPEHQALVVTGRLTEGAVLRSGRDDIWMIDLSAMEQPGGELDLIGSLVLEDDPFPVVVHGEIDRVYIGNLTDHSVSVLTSRLQDAPLPDVPLTIIDVAPGAEVTPGDLEDVDGSGTLAELAKLAVADADDTPDDAWTLTYIDGTQRLLVPTAQDDLVGLVRWESGGGPYVESAWGLEEGLPDLRDPFVEIDNDGFPSMYLATPAGDIFRAASGTLAGEWAIATSEPPLLTGALRSAPSAAPLFGEVALFFDVRDAESEPARIGLATSQDGFDFSDEGDVLVPPPGLSYEDPFAVFDTAVGHYRMWLTIHQLATDRWTIGLSESEDGRSWSDPITVLEVPGGAVASPTVAPLEGRYGLWVALGDGTLWDVGESWSHDGRVWTTPEVVVPGDPDVVGPQRTAVQADRVGAWRVEGRDIGAFDSLLPAGAGAPFDLGGFEIAVSQGHALSNNDVVRRLRAGLALVPGSVVDLDDGRRLLFATSTGTGERSRIVVLEETANGWQTAVEPDERDGEPGMEEMLEVDPGERATSPVVTVDADGTLVMLYARRSGGSTRVERATSPDGLVWTRDNSTVIRQADDIQWDSVAQVPHSLEDLGDGTFRLWYSGDDGSRQRIGSATGPLRDRMSREPGPADDFRMGTGLPGSFDDSAVKDPLAIQIDGQTHLIYAGFDGTEWHLGHAVVNDNNGRIERRSDPLSGLSLAAMHGQIRTFSALGVEAPIVLDATTDPIQLMYAGSDGLALRIGEAVLHPAAPQTVFAAQRFPTAGDLLSFETQRGGEGDQVIELSQLVDAFVTDGTGMSSIAHDADRGFLYVTSKLIDDVYVVDVRDDSSGSFVDANHLDLEGLIRVDTGSGTAGFRSAQVAPGRSLMYLTMRNPDGIVIIDLSRLEDNDVKEVREEVAVATLPLPDLDRDAGQDTFASIGGAGMALTEDERYLLVTHFRGNGLSVFDLDLGAWGEEVAWLPGLGEGPHVVRLSPDGRYAVVANYTGEVEGDTVSASLAIIDVDPTSDGFLEVAGWLVNR